ncbi:T9SS type A sorting domain-containing protein [Flavobacterium jejuense]|uniref:T9SS type A sorting domain-containing protein n=1 Tax=Flavobacterium jejuense TaxID=1544455 RepID=A0ABX0IN38_9FLAO|nr:T9SS type A sorting domain-containing protein [Flavobacterium jejuense]NHN24372.1 T9SS type A sorting domain-containing protein [Flavobacterium jejuense]
MKKNKLLFFLTTISFIGITSCFAQESPTASGGDLIGSNGSVSYSVGQVVYTTNTGSNGSVTQGVQQPYEISEVLSTDNFSELVKNLKVFPNPSTDVLTLNMINTGDLQLDYQIVDINGKVLKAEKNIPNVTNITVSAFPSAIYFLKITNQNKEVKTFKIIKK